MRTRRKGRGERSPDLFTLHCEECGDCLQATEGGYLACPRGHGRLMLDAGRVDEEPPGEPCGSLFDTDPQE